VHASDLQPDRASERGAGDGRPAEGLAVGLDPDRGLGLDRDATAGPRPDVGALEVRAVPEQPGGTDDVGRRASPRLDVQPPVVGQRPRRDLQSAAEELPVRDDDVAEPPLVLAAVVPDAHLGALKIIAQMGKYGKTSTFLERIVTIGFIAWMNGAELVVDGGFTAH
ncbi:MAG: hypothetical protein EBT87_06505, partial [Alphaproteobacteria bacterium]|nr:hypothetical protein [Alphaproteobacteria bacterium]